MSIVEIWKDIVGFENLYKVSNLGNVKRCSSGRILKQLNGMDGYKQVSLCKNGVPKTYLIHRLVSQAFIPNPNNLPCVNHKDENKTNNRVDNLEWCTVKYNINYGTSLKRRANTQSTPVLQYDKNGNLLNEYPSIIEGARKTGIYVGCICSVCRGKYKSAGGFIWKYKQKSGVN